MEFLVSIEFGLFPDKTMDRDDYDFFRFRLANKMFAANQRIDTVGGYPRVVEGTPEDLMSDDILFATDENHNSPDDISSYMMSDDENCDARWSAENPICVCFRCKMNKSMFNMMCDRCAGGRCIVQTCSNDMATPEWCATQKLPYRGCCERHAVSTHKKCVIDGCSKKIASNNSTLGFVVMAMSCLAKKQNPTLLYCDEHACGKYLGFCDTCPNAKMPGLMHCLIH